MNELKKFVVFGNVWMFAMGDWNERICGKEQAQPISHDINKTSKMLYDLLDIFKEIKSAKENEQYATLLSYYDSSSGVSPISSKLP